MVIDTRGFILSYCVGAASENDRDGVKVVLNKTREKYTGVKKMWADIEYQSKNLKIYIKEEYGMDVEIVKRPPCGFWIYKDTPLALLPAREQGFKIQPRRWFVEGTFA